MNQPLTDQQLTPAEIRLAQYGQRTSTWSTATYNDGTEKALHEIALGLKAEVDRLRSSLADQRAYETRLREQHDHDVAEVHRLRAELDAAARRDITLPLAVIVKHGEMSETVRREISDLLADADAAAPVVAAVSSAAEDGDQ